MSFNNGAIIGDEWPWTS